MSFKEYFKEQLNKDEWSLTIEDLKKWTNDFDEVQEQVNKWLKGHRCMEVEEQLDFLIDKLYHTLAFSICSDTHEPLEYIDFNYGSITCTISIYDRTVAELLPCFDGYISRNGVEQEGCNCDIDINEIKEIIKESEGA